MNRSDHQPPFDQPFLAPRTTFSQDESAGTHADADAGARGLVSKGKLIVVTGLYVATLLWAYATIVSPAFAYDGCTLAWPSATQMMWLIMLSLLPAVVMPYSLSRPSALVLWWIYLSVYVPSILVPALSLSMPFERLLPLQISLLLCMGFLCLASSSKLLAINPIAISPTLFWPLFLLTWGACLTFVCVHGRGGIVLGNLASLFAGASEYAIRDTYRELVLEAGRSVAYVVGQLANALNPFLIASGLVYRRRVYLVAGVVGQVVVFGLTGFKSALFSIAFLALLAVFIRRWRHRFGLAIALGLLAAIFVCAIADHATDNVLFSSRFTRRALVVPGLLTGFYFEHYSDVSPVGVGFHFSRDEAFVGPANAIGFAYFGNLETNANANFWAEGFAELGLPGIVAFTFIVAFMLWVYDSISAKRDLMLASLLTAMPVATLSNTSPLTAMVSEGALAAALVLYLSPPPHPREASELQTEPQESPGLSAVITSV